MPLTRTYILSGIVAFFAALILGITFVSASCGGDDDDVDDFGESSDPRGNIPTEQLKKVNVVLNGADWAVGKNNFVIGVTDEKDEPQGGATAMLTFFDVRDSSNPKPVGTFQAVQSAPGVGATVNHVHEGSGEVHKHGGQDDNRVGYYVTVEFPFAGFWGVSAEVTLKDGTRGTQNIGFTVSEKHRFVGPGQAAPKSDNLTKKDVANIKEIDSGTPPNDMHDVKIKDAISAGRPLVVVFSTPAFCTSRFCGPVNEEVEALRDVYKAQVDFVHIEIWRDFQKQLINPTVNEWLAQPDGSLTEPVVYVVDRSGMVFDRWEGPVAKNIMESSVKAVAGGATYAK